MTDDQQLDATGLKCPLPVLKAGKAMKKLESGAILTVTATDPGAPKDFEAFCDSQGCTLLESSESDGIYRFRLQKP